MKRSSIRPLFCFGLLGILAVAAAAPVPAREEGPTRDRPALLSVPLGSDPAAVVARLQALDLDIACVSLREGIAHVVADRSDMERLDRAGPAYRVLHRDLVAFYQSRFEKGLTSDLGYGSMGGYFTYSEVAAKLDEWRANHPDLVSQKISIGKSHEDRDLWAVKISDNPDLDEDEPEALIDCLTHAREPQGMMSTLYFMNWVLEHYPSDPMAKFLVENREMWFVPVQNPDGYVYNEQTHPNGGGMWRKNRRWNNFWSRGVDLNRNWSYRWGYDNSGSSPDPGSETYRGPAPLSEPEDQALADFIEARGVTERMSVHCYGGYWLIPWCYEKIFTKDDDLFRALGQEMAPPDYEVGTSWELLYLVNGDSLDWDYGEAGILTFSPEMGGLGDGFWPGTKKIVPIAEDNLPGLKYFFAVAGAYLQMTGFAVTDLTGDLDGYPDAGEELAVTVTLKNFGLLDGAGPVTLRLETADPHVTVLQGTVQIPALPSRAEGDNGASPFTLLLHPDAPYGQPVSFTVTFEFDGAAFQDGLEFITGTPRRMIADPLEAWADAWTVGVPGDTAEAGTWIAVDPHGTFYNGEPVQPEDDHTPGGTTCFVTEDGPPGSAPDAHDVDGGKTTIITPCFDLTGGTRPRIGFSRFFGHPESFGYLDYFKAAVSNDDGATWVNLETLQGQGWNLWVERSFDVEDYVTATDRMRVRFVVMDAGVDSITEGAVDDFWAECYSTKPVLSLYGHPALGETLVVGTAFEGGSTLGLYAALAAGPGVNLPGGTWYLLWPWVDLGFSTLPPDGTAAYIVPVPNEPALQGATLYFQALALPPWGGPVLVSNLASGVVE